MTRLRKTAILPGLAALAAAACHWVGAPLIVEDFDGGSLEPSVWDTCQISEASPLLFPASEGPAPVRFMRILADQASLGGISCHEGATAVMEAARPERPREMIGRAAPAAPSEEAAGLPLALQEEPESLGPSFIRHEMRQEAERRTARALTDPGTPRPHTGMGRNPYCTPEVLERARQAGREGECIQRQELRLRPEYRVRSSRPMLYSLRFRMPEPVRDARNSVRWVTAQWKQEPISARYDDEFKKGWGPSPFLAQRYDDGVLHVTVLDEHCSCMVASAPLPDGTRQDWQDGTPSRCASIHPDHEGEACTPRFEATYGADPVLASPLHDWVEMTYRVQADPEKPATVEVFQDGRFIVRVSGRIGYRADAARPPSTKFKLGHYRDYMPYVDAMDVDRVSILPLAP